MPRHACPWRRFAQPGFDFRGQDVKPPFTYFGGKTRIAPKIAALLPAHEHYVEPFAGSLAVLLAKPPSRFETVNDLDGDLMTFWRVLRDQPEQLERACALTPHSRAEHQASLEPGPELDDIERARRVWVKLTQGRGGQLVQRTGWRYYVDPRGSSASMPGYLATPPPSAGGSRCCGPIGRSRPSWRS